MKILIEFPESVPDAIYPKIHNGIAMTLGLHGTNSLGLPMTIERVDSAQHPSNYQVVDHGHNRLNGESWALFALLRFKLPPGAPVQLPADTDPDTRAAQQGLAQEQEERAMLQACANAGCHIQPERNGLRFSNPPWFQYFGHHVLITQSGGLDT